MLNYAKPFILYPLAEKYLGRDIRSKVKALKHLEAQSPDERAIHQRKRLAEVVASAGAHVPYYRDLFRTIGFHPERLETSIQYLQEIPLLTKDILREQGSRMLHEGFRESELHRRRTNGSTGLVTNVWYDQDSLDWTAAVSRVASERTGQSKTTTSVHLSSRFFEKLPAREAIVEQVRSWALNRTNVSVLSLDPSGLDDILKQLRALRPFAVQGHPSSLYFLALHAKETGVDARGLFQVFESTGESIDRAKAAVIESVFGCRIFNRYGNAEFGVVALSRAGRIDELEIIDSVVYPESHSLGNGLEELIFTGLMNTAMPLIRYRTGDVGEVATGPNGGQLIRRLTGRVHDIFEFNGQRYPTHFLKEILERVGGVDEFQIVQRESSSVLKVVPNHHYRGDMAEAKIREHFGPALRIETTTLDGLILQGWRDKFRYLVKLHS